MQQADAYLSSPATITEGTANSSIPGLTEKSGTRLLSHDELHMNPEHGTKIDSNIISIMIKDFIIPI